MIIVRARYYDGKSSASHEVELRLPDSGSDPIRVSGDGIDLTYALANVRASPRIGDSRRSLYLPDGGLCETDDNESIDRAFSATHEGRLHGALHRWESRFRYVALAIVLTVGLLWLIIEYAVPMLAREVALNMPPSAELRIGEGALSSLDRFLFKPSALTGARKEELRHLFADIAGKESEYKLEFRQGGRMGANAIALPAGTVVLTDELVKLSERDDELVAVLAHEVGHLKQRHALRHVLENSVAALLIVAITGDVNSILGGVPIAVIGARYSRAFEREADDFAVHYLRNRGIDPVVFSDILLRLEKQHPQGSFPTFLSSHPATIERAQRAHGLQGN
jgi:Zn-dependent protease with chaperone function